MTRDSPLIITLIVALGSAVLLARWADAHRPTDQAQTNAEQLYLNGSAAKRFSLAFNGLAADWYWMRSLQYVGGKIVSYEDSHAGHFDLQNLSSIDLRLLPSLLRMATTLDPQFIPVYEYGAVILPEIDSNEAITLLNSGIASNPSSWRLYQHLGYIYWQRQEYERASDAYAAGARVMGAPAWMMAMAARMKAEGGSRKAAGDMYQHLYDSSGDESVKKMVESQLSRLDSLDERDVIRDILIAFKVRNGRCVRSWREVHDELAAAEIELRPLTEEDSVRSYHKFHFDANAAPFDPSWTAYRFTNGGCDVDLD